MCTVLGSPSGSRGSGRLGVCVCRFSLRVWEVLSKDRKDKTTDTEPGTEYRTLLKMVRLKILSLNRNKMV